MIKFRYLNYLMKLMKYPMKTSLFSFIQMVYYHLKQIVRIYFYKNLHIQKKESPEEKNMIFTQRKEKI